MKSGYMKYDPLHHHGPTPLYLRQLFLGFHQSPQWEEWSEPILRRSGIFCSILTLALFLLMLARHSTLAAFLTGLLFAAHPYLIYYHSQAIHEPIFVFFGISLLSCLYFSRARASGVMMLFAGIFAGLFQSSKETWVLLPVCTIFAWGLTGSFRSYLTLFFRSPGAYFFWGTAVFVSTLFYSGFFHDLRGIARSWSTFWCYQTELGHAKPFFWYFQSLFGLFPFNASLFLCSLVWIIPWIPLKKEPMAPSWVREWKWIALCQLMSYSLISYKTPWLLLLAWSLILPAVGCKLAAFLRSSFVHQVGAIIALFLLGIGFYCLQWRPSQAVFYPYSYSATSKEIEGVLSVVEKKQKSLNHEIRIAVEGASYWPIPWYLRGFHSVGYFEVGGPDGFDLILKVEPRLIVDPAFESLELRENIGVTVIDPKDRR